MPTHLKKFNYSMSCNSNENDANNSQTEHAIKQRAVFTFIFRHIQDLINCLRETHAMFFCGGLKGKCSLQHMTFYIVFFNLFYSSHCMRLIL